MAIRFYSDFQNDVGDKFRINIHDTDFSLTATELTASVPGFMLSYEGNNQEQYQPIIASKLEFTLYNEGGDFNTWLNDVVPAATEARFLIEVLSSPGEIDEALWWRGVLLPEQIQQNDEPTPTAVSFVASDDLVQLRESTWDDLSLTAYTIADAIHAILSLVRYKDLYSDDDLFLRYINDIQPEAYTGSDYLDGGSMYAPTIPGEDPIAFYNCYDILRSIAITFNARVFQAEGIWYFMPLAKFQQRSDSVAFTGDMYAMQADGDAATWTTLEKVQWNSQMLLSTSLTKMAGNIIEYSRPTKRVDRVRITKANEFLFQENTGFTTLAGGSDDIDFSDDDRTYFEGSTHLITVSYNFEINSVASENNFVNENTVRADLTIKFGDQYFTDSGWSGTAGVHTTIIGTYFKSFGFEDIGEFSVQVPQLEDDEVGLDINLNTVVINGAGVDITGSLPTHSALHILRVFAGDSADNLGDSVTFSSQTSLDNQVTLTQSDVITGTVALSYGVGLSDVQYGSGSYFGIGLDHSTWTSSQTSTGYSLNRLGVREIMYNTQLPHRIRNGAFYINAAASWVWPYNIVREESEDHGIHQLTYSANDSQVTIERWQLNQDTSNLTFRTDEVGTDNPRDQFTPSGSNTTARLSNAVSTLQEGSRPVFKKVIEIDATQGSTHTVDVDCSNGYMYMVSYTDSADGFGSVILPKVADNEGRLLRFKTDDSISTTKYVKLGLTSEEVTDGVRIDGQESFSGVRAYDGIMVLCHDGQWFVIQRKAGSAAAGDTDAWKIGEITSTDLVAHWDASNSNSYGYSGTTVTDVVGAVTLTLQNGAFWQQVAGIDSFKFDGTNDDLGRSDTPSDLQFQFSDAFSIGIWLNPAFSNTAGFMCFCGNPDQGGSFDGISFINGATNDRLTPRLWLRSSGSSFLICEMNGQLTQDSWQYLVVTYAGSKAVSSVKFYLNGSEVTGTTGTNTGGALTINHSGNKYTIGSRDSINSFYGGEIADVHVYDDALSASEVLDNYNNTKAKFML